MAIWQFSTYLIPGQSLRKKYGEIPRQMLMDEADWDKFFEKENPETMPDFADLNILLDDIYALLTDIGDLVSWSADADFKRSFGDPDTNDITAYFHERTKIVETVNCRFDLRQPNLSFINKTLSFAKKFECFLMDKEGKLHQPSAMSLFEAIKISDSYPYLSDAEKFLKDLLKEIAT